MFSDQEKFDYKMKFLVNVPSINKWMNGKPIWPVLIPCVEMSAGDYLKEPLSPFAQAPITLPGSHAMQILGPAVQKSGYLQSVTSKGFPIQALTQ